MAEKRWHGLPVGETLKELSTSDSGLSLEEAQRRLAVFGPNELVEKKKTPLWLVFLEQFKDFLIIILLVAAVISIVLAILGEGDPWDPALIVSIVVFAAALGFIQENRSERAIEALKRMAAPTAAVVRGGEESSVPARELVPGDVVVLRTGSRVPADGRLLEAVNLKTDEAPLTGESTSVDKDATLVLGEVPVGDRKNMVHTGTTVVNGRGKAVVTSTGMGTEFGKIAGMLQEVEAPPTPLEVSMDKVGKVLGIGCLAISAVVAVLGMAVGMFDGILGAFIWGVSLAVAAVPEALPAVVTVCLALGVQRMAHRHGLMRHLPMVEALGCTTYICSDKTGTLTQNEMTVRKLYVDGKLIDITGVGYEPQGDFVLGGSRFDPVQDVHVQSLLRAAVLCNDSSLVHAEGTWQIRGDPTEGSLLVAAAKAGMDLEKMATEAPRHEEVPFTSERKRMTTIHVHGGGLGRTAYAKGAPEVILDSCDRILAGGRERPLSGEDKVAILKTNELMAQQALRVLAMANKPAHQGELPEEAEKGMVFLGLAGMIDPPREEVKGAIQLCREAGIQSVMITGDHKLTATAIAGELGMQDQNGLAVTGEELDKMSDADLEEKIDRIKVYARVSPAHKMRVVEALQKKGHVVAMTGDGVNDAPALKKADIGVAMGITGTDVSKEAAAMVLTDDNFASIVAAVEEGRTVFANIKKFLMYLLSSNVGEVLLMLTAFIVTTALGKLVVPLVAVQLLWVNLVTDGLPALALAVDPAEPQIMRHPPRSRKEGVFSRYVVGYVVGVGAWTMVAVLGVFLWALLSGREAVEAQALAFATLVLVELLNCFNCRSEERSIFSRGGLLGNKWLVFAVASSLALSLVVMYVPFFQGPFHTYGLSLADWGVVLLAAFSVIAVVEIAKLVLASRARRRVVLATA